MRISEVLRAKGSVVATAKPDTPAASVLGEMARRGVGAVVVVRDGVVVGMVWERDVIRLLHQRGASIIDAPVSEIMRVEVVNCAPSDKVDDILRTMTDHEIRHLPVVADGELIGVISMGDLVKARIDELETDRAHLQSYITAG